MNEITKNTQLKTLILFLLCLLTIVLFFTYLDKNFLTVSSFKSLLRHASRNALASLGLTFVTIVGHADMSFGYIGSLAGMTTSILIANDFGVLISVTAGLIFGLVWGLFNGFIISKLKLPDMVVTIGTGAIAYGLSYIYSNGAFIYTNFLTSGILDLNDKIIFGFPLPVILAGLAFIFGYYILHKTYFGRCFYATGENYIASVFSGIKVKSYILASFTISAVLGSLAVILATASQGVGNVKTGTVLLLPSYAVVYLGISIFKKPSVIGTLLGSIFISLMLQGFTMINIPYYFRDLIISFILVFSLSLSTKIKLKKWPKKDILIKRREGFTHEKEG